MPTELEVNLNGMYNKIINRIHPKIRTIIAWLYCTFTMNIIVMTMGLIDWKKGLEFNNDMYWSGQIATLSVFFFFYYTGYGQKK